MKKTFLDCSSSLILSLSIIVFLIFTMAFNVNAQNMDIRGPLRIVDGTQGIGKVLTSDATGLTSWKTIGTQTYAVGDKALGGTVFYVNSTGTHGLVVSNKDQGDFADWYGAQQLINIPDKHDTNGKEYLDWRLPKEWELKLIYTLLSNNTLPATLNFASEFYWCSQETVRITYVAPSLTIVDNEAYLIHFGNGREEFQPKNTGFLKTRAIRSF